MSSVAPSPRKRATIWDCPAARLNLQAPSHASPLHTCSSGRRLLYDQRTLLPFNPSIIVHLGDRDHSKTVIPFPSPIQVTAEICVSSAEPRSPISGLTQILSNI